MEEDIFYVPEIELIDEVVSIGVADVSLQTTVTGLNADLLELLLCSKDKVMLEEYVETRHLTKRTLEFHRMIKDDIIYRISTIFIGYSHVESFAYDEINVVSPNKSFTIDRVLSFNPTRIIILLRG